jgi:hypothetical protein
LLGLNLGQVDLQLFGDEHRAGREGSLAHFNLGNDDGHSTILADAYEPPGREVLSCGGLIHSREAREGEGDEEPAAKRGAGAQEISPGETS